MKCEESQLSPKDCNTAKEVTTSGCMSHCPQCVKRQILKEFGGEDCKGICYMMGYF